LKTVIRALAAVAAFVFSGVGFAQLTPGTPIATGTAQSLTPSVQNAGGNTVYSSGNFADSTRWITTAGTTVANTNTAYSIERGTYPATLTGTLATSQISQSTTITTANMTAVASAYFTVKQGGTLIANASSSVEMGILYGTPAKTYYVRFNPATGQVTGSTGTRVSVSVQSIPTYDPFIPGAVNMWYRVGLGVQNYAPTSATATFYIKPNVNASATGTKVIAYGAQVESTPTNLTGITYTAASTITSQPSAYLATTQQSLTTRLAGTLPRQSVLDTQLTYNISAATVVYDSTYNGYIFYAAGAAGASTINLPGANDNIQPGEYFTVFNYVTSTNNITVAAALLGQIVAPDATTTSVTIAPGYAATFVARTNVIWYMTDMYSGGSSPPIPAPGAAGTILRSNGTSWAVSQDTFPDLVASGNVMFATAANTWGSSANFTYASGILSLASTDQFRFGTDAYVTRYAAKQLMISGDGVGATTNAGLTLGYAGSASFGGIVISGTALTTSSYNILATPTSTWIGTPNAAGVIYFFPSAAGSQKMALTATGGTGPSITAGTATTAVSPLAITQTWNAEGVKFPGITFNATDTASAAATKLIDLQVASASKFNVDKAGLITTNSKTMIASNQAFTNGAAASLGTLTNAPAEGDPTKWIPINDNGTTRYIPAW